MILQGYGRHWVVFRLALCQTRPVGGTDGSDREAYRQAQRVQSLWTQRRSVTIRRIVSTAAEVRAPGDWIDSDADRLPVETEIGNSVDDAEARGSWPALNVSTS